jgi:NAD(P)-dependent dehydrogenase (short-subunit alcohol dehydrogenase family)
MGPPKIALIFGMGARVGVEVARAFAAKGYKVAGVSRSGRLEGVAHEYELVSADLSKPGSVEQAFAQVKERLGLPSVVIYNRM